MVIFKEAAALSDYLGLRKKEGHSTGFVPTMGALHQGHISLIEMSRQDHDLTVCSIFINPTQFNNQEDFKHYPVTIEKDIALLEGSGCNVLFLPSVMEIYPEGYQKKYYELGPIENILEGAYRPGHFQGVCQVVHRLLDIIQPGNLYLGQKDFQQCMVIKKLLSLLNKEDEVNLHIAPTLREKDGLAMSSRNLRLDKEERSRATAIYRELENIRKELHHQSLDDLKQNARKVLEQEGFRVDYIEIANSHDLLPVEKISPSMVALAAATLGNVRLIDNLVIN